VISTPPRRAAAARSWSARPDQQQRQLADSGGELVPDHERRLVGPLQVIDDQHRGGGRAQLVGQRQQHLDAGDRRVAVAEQPRALAAEQSRGPRPPRVG
jgi:hypothetical protein